MEGGRVSIDELKKHAEASLDYAIERIRETGDLMMMFHLVHSDGHLEIMFIDGPLTNDEDGKAQMARELKARCRAGGIEAIIHVSDSFFAENMSEEANRIRRAFRMTIEQCAAAGLCRLREAVMVRLESPIYWLHMTQEYKRDGGKVELVGAIIRTDSLDGGPLGDGRFNGYWPEQPEARA